MKKKDTDSIQFGEGNFMRAFVDYCIQLLNEETDFVGKVNIVQPIEKGMIDDLKNQNGKYHVFQEGVIEGTQLRSRHLIDCIDKLINPYVEFQSYLKLAENESLTFIFSNTTEAGIAYDINDNINDKPPNSFPAKLLMLLYQRFQKFNGDPSMILHIIPCELIEKNGLKLKEILIEISDKWELGEKFKFWLNLNKFYNTLVDRIVPGFPKNDIDFYEKGLPFKDKLMVTCEPFFLWVIEGSKELLEIFPADRLKKINLIVVDDLKVYRTRKVRILNGCHTTMVPVGLLNKTSTVSDALNNDFLKSFIKEAIFEEIIPSIDFDEDELKNYAASVLERFSNPFIIHKLESIALNSISKFKVRVLPSILSYIKKEGKAPKNLSFAMASLIYYYGKEISQHSYELNDEPSNIEFFKKVWETESTKRVTDETLSKSSLWGQNLAEIKLLKDKVNIALEAIHSCHKIDVAYDIFKKNI
jgi:tagaturonate reductase